MSPNIYAYSEVLQQGVDYIGTRLHAGIFAMQHKVRAFILAVDNRAQDMAMTFGINSILRALEDELENLKTLVEKEHITQVNIHEAEIQKWKNQFV